MNIKCHYDGKRSRGEMIADIVAAIMLLAFMAAVVAEVVVE